MSLDTQITSNLDQTARSLASAEQRAEARLRGINNRAARELLRVARSVVHVKTGRLRDGLQISGPFDVSTGVLETVIDAPSVPYAELEVDRGGEHDFVQQTLDAGAGIIDQAAEDMERAIVEEIER